MYVFTQSLHYILFILAVLHFRSTTDVDNGKKAEINTFFFKRYMNIFDQNKCCQMINRIQKKSFCLHNICVCTV